MSPPQSLCRKYCAPLEFTTGKCQAEVSKDHEGLPRASLNCTCNEHGISVVPNQTAPVVFDGVVSLVSGCEDRGVHFCLTTDCHHGRCDRKTLSCSCDKGWKGVGCDVEDKIEDKLQLLLYGLAGLAGLVLISVLVLTVAIYCTRRGGRRRRRDGAYAGEDSEFGEAYEMSPSERSNLRRLNLKHDGGGGIAKGTEGIPVGRVGTFKNRKDSTDSDGSEHSRDRHDHGMRNGETDIQQQQQQGTEAKTLEVSFSGSDEGVQSPSAPVHVGGTRTRERGVDVSKAFSYISVEPGPSGLRRTPFKQQQSTESMLTKSITTDLPPLKTISTTRLEASDTKSKAKEHNNNTNQMIINPAVVSRNVSRKIAKFEHISQN